MSRLAGGRKAVTLVELLVVLLLLGITAGAVGLTLHTARPVATIDATQAAIQAARDSAIRFGRSVTVAVAADGSTRPITAYPDGRVVADLTVHLNQLTGGPDAAH